MPYVLIESKRRDQWNSMSRTFVLGLQMDQKVTLVTLLSGSSTYMDGTDGDSYDPDVEAIKFKLSPIGILNALEKMGFTVISTHVRETVETEDGTNYTHYSWTMYKEIEFD